MRGMTPSFYDPELSSGPQPNAGSGRNGGLNSQGHTRKGSLGTGMPPAGVLLRGYAQNATTGISEAMEMTRRQAQARASSKMDSRHHDPMSMHLLISNAILDSSAFEILALEEIDGLKKEYHSIQLKLDAKKRKLALESKVRDAAASLHRLQNTGPTSSRSSPSINGSAELDRHSGRRQSNMAFLGRQHRGSDLLGKSDEELALSNRRCEDLAQEIWRLEERSNEIQKRLLRHSTGVLGLTHQHAIKKAGGRTISGNSKPQLPDSPESSPQDDEDGLEFGERSFYRSHERLDELGISWAMPQLADRMSIQDPDHRERQTLAADIEKHSTMIQDAEKKLASLNAQVRDLISSAKSQNGSATKTDGTVLPDQPPESDLQSQLNYLQAGLGKVQSYQKDLQDRGVAEDSTEGKLADLNIRLYEMLCQEDMGQAQALAPPPNRGTGNNIQIDYLYRSLQEIESIHSSIPAQRDAVTKAESYEDALSGIWSMLSNHPSSADTDQPHPDSQEGISPTGIAAGLPFSLSNFSATIQRLLRQHQEMQKEKTILRRQIEQQRQARDLQEDALTEHHSKMEQTLKELDEHKQARDMQEDALIDHQKRHEENVRELGEHRSNLQTKHAEVISLSQELERHRDQLDSKHAEVSALSRELEQHREQLDSKNTEVQALDKELLHNKGELDAARTHLSGRQQEESTTLATIRTELQSRDQEISRLEDEMEDMRDEANRQLSALEAHHAGSGPQIKSLLSQLEALNREHAATTARAAAAETHAAELDGLDGEVVRLKTELALARAEVDSAQGSRAQRALDIANNPEVARRFEDLAVQRRRVEADLQLALEHRARYEAERDGLAERAGALEAELQVVVAELEEGARAGLEWEREREAAEEEVDRLLQRIEGLEVELGERKVAELGGAGGGGASAREPPGTAGSRASSGTGTGTGTVSGEGVALGVMRTEFKRMMREMRKEGMERLRREVEERRRLEGVVRDMRRREKERIGVDGAGSGVGAGTRTGSEETG